MAEENSQEPQDNIIPEPKQNISAKDKLMQSSTPPTTPTHAPEPTPTPTPEPTSAPVSEPENKVQGKPKVDLGHTTELKDWPPKDTPKEVKEEETSLRTIRTYKDDLAQVVGKKKESLVSIVTAENERRVKDGESLTSISDDSELKKQQFKKIGIIILITTLFVLGAGSIFYFYGKSDTETVKPDSTIPSIIFSDEEEEFEITNLSRRQILNGLTTLKDRANISIGRIKNVFITESFVNEEGVKGRELVSASNFLNAINAQLPTSFLRSLEPLFMFGIHQFDGSQPFLVLRNSFYENTFAGMLSWERDIKEDLAPLFGPAKFDVVSSGDSGTSIPPLSIPTFNDFVVKNKDARVLRDSTGNIVLMYSFIDKSTIVITTNENTFSEVFIRLTSSRILR